MTINPNTPEWYKKHQAVEIERVRKEIRKLPVDIREKISEGEDLIDKCIGLKINLNIYKLNVFHLQENVNGEVMKYLAMLFSAGGFCDVFVGPDCFSSQDCSNMVTYPNQISFRSVR